MLKLWVLRVTLLTLFLSMAFAVLSEMVLRNLNIVFALIVYLIIIFTGIFFDMIGIAFAMCDIKPFNSMAARKVKASKRAVELLHKSAMVSNFCNDVVGDISGIISGSVAAIIIISISKYDIRISNVSLLTVLMSSLTSAVTVGGKAYGKTIALKKSKEIVYRFSYIVDAIERIIHRKLF